MWIFLLRRLIARLSGATNRRAAIARLLSTAHSQFSCSKFADNQMRSEVIMNTSIVGKTAVDSATQVAAGAAEKPVPDSERGTPSLPLGPVGSEDITVRRPPASSAKKALTVMPLLTTPLIRIKHLLAGLMLVSVVGCGTTTADRAVSGAGIGAGAGAVLGAVTGLGPGTGAAIGAATGAAAGGLTKKKQINLGKPIWR